MAQSRMDFPLTNMLCVLILSLITLCFASDNNSSSKSRDSKVSKLLFWVSTTREPRLTTGVHNDLGEVKPEKPKLAKVPFRSHNAVKKQQILKHHLMRHEHLNGCLFKILIF